MKWSYGVTTVPSRKDTLLKRTITSLAKGGFDKPRLFVDHLKNAEEYSSFGLEVTARFPCIQIVGNWTLAAWELYIREPKADRYAIFQDDLVTCLNLREYLEKSEYPEKSYLNLYTFPKNEALADGKKGWHLSDQLGKSAVALVFSHEALMVIFSSTKFIEKAQDHRRGRHCIDGCVIGAMKELGWKEYVHAPSLTQHTGDKSSMKHHKYPPSETFRGENFDALELLK